MTLSHHEVTADKDRQQRHAAVVLRMLRDAGEQGVTNRQFVERVSHRFGGRILDLRQAGHVIELEHLGGGLWTYRLIERVEVENATQLGLWRVA